MTDDLPAPPIPAYIDLRTFDEMPLNVVKLMNSDSVFTTTGDEFKAAVTLWARAWHQVPAGSLPSNERHLAQMAGVGSDLRSWKAVREGAMKGFNLCSDGRYYHAVICEVAMRAWAKKSSGKEGAEARWNKTKSLENKKTTNANPSPSPNSKPNGKDHGHVADVPCGETMPRTELNRTDKTPPTPKGVESDDVKQEAVSLESLFESEFWPAYPEREGANPKKPALLKFVALCKRGEDPRAIIRGAQRYAADPSTKIGTPYVATAATWLNQERWKDREASGGSGPSLAAVSAAESPYRDIPVVVPTYTPVLQVKLAKSYLMHTETRDGAIVFVKPKRREERKWVFRDTFSNVVWPGPGEPGCPVTPQAFTLAATECGLKWPD
jgi:hypothetical protein